MCYERPATTTFWLLVLGVFYLGILVNAYCVKGAALSMRHQHFSALFNGTDCFQCQVCRLYCRVWGFFVRRKLNADGACYGLLCREKEPIIFFLSWQKFISASNGCNYWITYIFEHSYFFNWSLQNFRLDCNLASNAFHVQCFNFIHEFRFVFGPRVQV